jgi:hypothetical protein
MTEKFEMLEERVRDTVEDAKNTVKRSVDLRYHVAQRPWKMVGMSIAAGYVLGRLTFRPSTMARTRGVSSYGPNKASEFATASPYKAASTVNGEPKKSANILEEYKDELAILKGAAVGALVSVIQNLIKQVVPAVASRVKKTASSDQPGNEVSSLGSYK